MAETDPVAFLRATPPFDSLPQDLFDDAAKTVDVAYYPSGTQLTHVGGTPLAHLYVIRKGSVRLERGGQTLQVVEEGESFGFTSLLTGEATMDVTVDEDLVAYRIPGAAFRRLLVDPRFSGHFALGMAARLRASIDQDPVTLFRADLSGDLSQFAFRPPVWIAPTTTVGEAAKTMRDLRISSLLVRGDPPGIVTDRDFRNRVLADDLGPEEPVSRILSKPLLTIPSTLPLYDVWARLLDANVHHLPVIRDGEIVGVVTSGDLLRHSAQGPVAVLRGVERLPGRDSLSGYAGKVAEMTAALAAGKLMITTIAGFVARLNDTLLRRILRWAEEDLGPAPVPYAWLAFGSEGRMEQTLLTDQDNALVYADEGAGHREYFQALAERVNGDLERAGFPRCAGGYMARNWHFTISEWSQRFNAWIDSPQPKALLEASIFFDFRRVAGELSVEPLEEIIALSSGKSIFLRFLARSAMEFRPPPSLLLRLRGDSSELDIKLRGISPIVFLARAYALEAGSHARNTLERIAVARRAGLIDQENEENVAEAYRFLLGLRLRRQLKTLSEGGEASNKLTLAQLTAIERSRLKDSFRAIRFWQDRGAFHYHLD